MLRISLRRRAGRHAAQPDTERDIEQWLDTLRSNPDDLQDAKAALDRAMRVYHQVLLQQLHAGCSCTGGRVVVLHDRGTYCGDDQFTRIAHAIAEADGRYVGLPPLADLTYEQMAGVALDTLRGGRA